MQQNILRDSNVTKIYLLYEEKGLKKRVSLKLRFMDSRECYFAGSMPANFEKPKRKTPADLYVYTVDGVYNSKVSILNANVSMRDVLYEVTIPKKWDFIQLRRSTRKQVALPVSIKFNDGFELNETSFDLSLGGVSFFSRTQIPSIYKKISGVLSLQLPSDTLINFADGQMTVEAKFVREKEDIEGRFGEVLYIYKFMNVSPEDEDILRMFLIKID